jgi:hypothetical protein
MRRNSDKLRSTRHSYSYYPVDNPVLTERMRAAFPVEGYYTYLLNQDLEHVIPYDVGRDGEREVRVVGPDANRAMPLIASALSERGYPSLDDGVRDFVSSTAQHLVLGGPCTYEIDFLYSADEMGDDPPAAFRLELIAPGTFSTLGSTPIQYVLPTISPLRDRSGISYVSLDPSTLVTFTLPSDLVSPVRTMVDFLLAANREQGKDFALMERSLTESTPYDFTTHNREKGELFAEVTQPIGWNVRDLFKDNRLEPYSVWRQIRFLEFKVRVRDAILERLNQAIRRVGRKMDFAATIELTGLPTPGDVRTLKEDFRSGRRSLRDLVSSTF